MAWIMENLGTILISLALVLVVTGIIIKLIKDKKKGISSCGGNCSHCGMCGMCEAHIRDTIRNAFPDAKKVDASLGKGTADFLTMEVPSLQAAEGEVKQSMM